MNFFMKRFIALTLMLVFWSNGVAATQRQILRKQRASGERVAVYYPQRGKAWQHRRPSEVGMDARLLDEAVRFAESQESRVPRDFSTQEETFGRPLGPLPKERAGTNGLIIRRGYIVAEWGDTNRVDPTYSAAKSFLSTIFGLALDRGLIRDVHDPVRRYVNDGGYDSPQNSGVTWHHHLQQTSEWQGEMWGKSSDFIGVEEFGEGKREPRALQKPGTYYEYNDVRINRLALSLLRVWKRPLPEVLKSEVMDKIGASESWRYPGYFNSDVVISGRRVKSVSGGTRWGGGLWISARDEARFGYLFLRGGRWRNGQIVSKEWVRRATGPGNLKSDYGYLWWLNTDRKTWPSAPATSYAAIGYGTNTIWIDPEHDLVIVWRWHQGNGEELFKRVLASIKTS
jgi:CubicO group peptidase (beta-lactamase class C family)